MKKLWPLFIALALVGAAAAAFLALRRPSRAGMDLLSVLPAGLDLYAVADTGSLGSNSAIGKLLSDPPGLPRDADYDRFIRESGFRYQEDLRQLALAKDGADWAGAARIRVDRVRVDRYFESQGAEKRDVSGKTIYSFGRLRPFRLVFLGGTSRDTVVAFTIGGNDSRITQMATGRFRTSPGSAAAELKIGNDLTHIPQESRVWMVGRAGRLWAQNADAQVGTLGISTSMLRGSQTLYASLDPGPASLKFRIEDYCDTPASAQRIAGTLRGVLALLRAMPSPMPAAGFQPSLLLKGISIQETQQSVFIEWQWDEQALSFLESNARQ